MQALRAEPKTAACCPRPAASVRTTESAEDTMAVAPTLPTWTSLPSVRRRRLVAVLGAIVQRTRKEGLDEP